MASGMNDSCTNTFISYIKDSMEDINKSFDNWIDYANIHSKRVNWTDEQLSNNIIWINKIKDLTVKYYSTLLQAYSIELNEIHIAKKTIENDNDL